MTKPIPYGRQEITDEDVQAVVTALKSDYLTQGPKIEEFEKAFAGYIGSDYAIALSNGTAALHLSVLALGIEKDEYVICTPITFAASANCVLYCGGNVLFADIDPVTYLMDINSVRKVIEENKDKKIRGIIPVDFAGRVNNLEVFNELAQNHNLWIIEDACHAPGGFFLDSLNRKQIAGNCQYTNTAIFSFHPVKHIATGEGGMITTNDKVLYEKLMILRTHGITRNVEKFQNSIDIALSNNSDTSDDYPLWYMEMQELGFNYRITDVQAALGISQLKRAEKGLERRRLIAKRYTEELKGVSGIIRSSGNIKGHAYHLYVLEVENRKELYDYLREKNIYCQIHYIPVHMMPFYQDLGYELGDLPLSEEYYSRCISIPMFPGLSDEEVNLVISSIKEFYND